MRELPERPNGEDAERAYRRLKAPALLKARRWFPTLTEADLEDAYQSAWLSVVRTASPIADLKSYLYEAVRSEALTELRRRRRRSALGLSEVDAGLSRNGRRDEDAAAPTAGMLEESLIDDDQAGPEDQAHTHLLAAYADDLLSDLSARRQAVFVSEIDGHQGTLRALRLPEQPPALRRSLRGRRGAALQPEQVPSVLPAAFLKR